MKIPEEITDFVNARLAGKIPIHVPDSYVKFRDSKASCCWGNNGGLNVDGKYMISFCQPSPRTKGEPLQLWYDFVKI